MSTKPESQPAPSSPSPRPAPDVPIETTIKQKYQLFLAKKHLIEELFRLEGHKQVLEPFSYLWGSGGKRLRIIAAMLVSDLFREEMSDDVVRVGGVVELLHNASLIVDDIQDGSVERRGKPCSHMVYGVDNAINAANLLYFLPLHNLTRALSSPQLTLAVTQAYLREMTLCHVGQGLDVSTHRATSAAELPSREDYFLLTSHKTGGLMRMLVDMVGAVVGVPQEGLEMLREGLSHMGVAFQIVDDVLNLSNRETNMGKGVVAEDLHERKFTLIVDCLREHELFMELFFRRQKDEATIQQMLTIVEESGALERCAGFAQSYAEKAYACVEKLECPRPKATLLQFIRYIIERKS